MSPATKARQCGDKVRRTKAEAVATALSGPRRVQLRRTKGWRKPEGAVVVARPTRWGNPFRDGDWLMWAAVAIGLKADKAGRRQAAVAFHRSWLTGEPLRMREFDPIAGREYDGGAIEYSDGAVVPVGDVVVGFAALFASMSTGPTLPERPTDFAALAGHDLACWCPPGPCHADVLLELANQ